MTAYLTLATAAAQVSAYVLPCNILTSPVNTSFYAFKSLGGGAATEVSATIEFTIDPFNAPSQTWFTAPVGGGEFDKVVGVTSISFPHAGIRLRVTQVSGSVAIAFGAINVGM